MRPCSPRRSSRSLTVAGAGVDGRGSVPPRHSCNSGDPREVWCFSSTSARSSITPRWRGWMRSLRLTGQGNYEILVEWLTIAAGSDYEPVFGRIREVLTQRRCG